MATRRAVVVAAGGSSTGERRAEEIISSTVDHISARPYVEVTLAPGCANCTGCAGACVGTTKRWRVETTGVSLRPGHELDVHIDEHALKRIAITAYGAWLSGLLAGAVAGELVARLVLGAGQPHDFLVLAFAAAGTCAGWSWSHRRFRARARRGEFLTLTIEEKD